LILFLFFPDSPEFIEGSGWNGGKNRVSTEDFAFPDGKTIFKIFERFDGKWEVIKE
jgi:hypothetical protein